MSEIKTYSESIPPYQIWDCCNPAALVVLLLEELNRPPNEIEKRTLQCFGMIENDQIEISYAKKELERAKCIS